MKNSTKLFGNPAFFSRSVEGVYINAQSVLEHEIAAVLAPAKTRDDVKLFAKEFFAKHLSPNSAESDANENRVPWSLRSPLLVMSVDAGETGIIADIMFYVDIDIHDADYAFRVQLANINLVF